MKPNNAAFPSVLKEIPNASIHPICLETYDELAQMHVIFHQLTLGRLKIQ